MGAHVIVCEVAPVPALEALMDGFEVLPIEQAAAQGDIFVTATGNRGVIRREHFPLMKEGAILANSGHFDLEIDVAALRGLAVARRPAREHVEEYELPNGRRVYLLAEGRLVGQAAAEASPAAVMDMSFANQLLAVDYLAARARGERLAPGIYPVPPELDEEIARPQAGRARRADRRADRRAATLLGSWQMAEPVAVSWRRSTGTRARRGADPAVALRLDARTTVSSVRLERSEAIRPPRAGLTLAPRSPRWLASRAPAASESG